MTERLKKIILILIVLSVFPMNMAIADDSTEEVDATLWRELNQTSDTILRYVKEGHYEEAHQMLDSFSNQFLSIRASDYQLSMNELQVITSVFEEVTEATLSVSLSHDERVNKASKLRLLVDVYDKTYQPLWNKTRASIMDPVANMQMAAEKGDSRGYYIELNKFLEKYEIVRPAWSVNLPIEEYQQLDALVKYLNNTKQNNQDASKLVEHLKLLETQLTSIYDGGKEDVSDPSIIWVILTIGGAIVIALTYSGWRKYIGEKEKLTNVKREKRRNR